MSPEPLSVLLVEDSATSQSLVRAAVGSVAGFKITLSIAGTLAEGISMVLAEPVDVVLLDLGLPDSFGLATLTQLLATVPEMPIVVMTSSADADIAAEAMRLGAQDFLTKSHPDPLSLVRAICNARVRHRARVAMEEREKQLQLLAQRVPIILWTTDVDLRFTCSMGAALRQLGLAADQVVGLTLNEYFGSKNDPGGAIAAHRKALNGESFAFHASWKNRRYEVQVDPLMDDRARITGTIGVALDVTERRHHEESMQAARLIQDTLLPVATPDINGLDIAGRAFPAEQTRGDWFDFLELPDGAFGIVVGDVAGHGFPAAILAAATSAWIQSLAEMETDFSRILPVANRLFLKHAPDDRFAVGTFARIEADGRLFSVSSAGHRSVVVGPDGQVRHHLSATGPALGIDRNVTYTEPFQMLLEPGDIFAALTDGFEETASPSREFFGRDRIVQTIHEHRNESSDNILRALCMATNRFRETGRGQDDRTGVIVRVL